jgi:hypothetical protein
MNRIKSCVILTASLAFLSSVSAPAYAQASRTWVSGVGDDANPCSRTAPCKTFAGAISKTAAGGEINCLDPGGFGSLTITKAITISCEAGTAGVAATGVNGFIVNAGVNDFVTIRGIDFDGFGTGLVGISVLQAAAVHVQNCTIRNFRGGTAAGINIAPGAGVATNVMVSDTVLTGHGVGIQVKPSGTGVARLRALRVQTDANNTGIKIDGSTSTGGISVQIIESAATANGVSGMEAVGGAATFVNINRSSSSGNPGTGIKASAGAVVQVGESMVFGNGTGLSGVQTYRNNQVNGNGADGTPATAVSGGFAAPAGEN